MHDHTNKFASNMYKLNNYINMVYKRVVHKNIYHATNQIDSNYLQQFSKTNKW
jgi:hypothetical protein